MIISVLAFEPVPGEPVKKQVEACIRRLAKLCSTKAQPAGSVISINFFTSALNNNAFNLLKQTIAHALKDLDLGELPVAILAQAPASGADVALEVHSIREAAGLSVHRRKAGPYPYLVAEDRNGEKLVAGNGIGMNHDAMNITAAAEHAFETIRNILRQESLDFGHIFRQWNYIEGITRIRDDAEQSQHYQEFNNVRAAYYQESAFRNGYPAATGIGTRAGGVSIGFFAASEGLFSAGALENPLQRAAFSYSDRVLVGDSDYRGACKCSPRFSRAKWISNDKTYQMFISGTASIREEKTVGVDDIVKQTTTTLENISQLIGEAGKPVSVSYIRVYVKDAGDYAVVRSLCEEHFPGIPGLYVVSDICRENLLVEIEAVALGLS